MPSALDEAYLRVNQLAADFKANEKFYLSPAYQEAEARRDFIDKFFVAFGWDVNHDTQKNPYEQEVKVERKDHGVSQRRADYAFYITPNFRDVKFYIEAKKPFGDIATTDNYFQTIRYGWNSQTPIAALFDFEQFEIVDCRFKPDLETALQRNLKKFHYSQFADKEKFAEIYWLFSREAVARGSLEKYAEALPKKRVAVQRGLFKGGYQSIDEAFLEELDAHRDKLAHMFKNSNPKLDGEALTEATQRTLDRLVFIRFLEDKLIEPQYLVAKFGERGSPKDHSEGLAEHAGPIMNEITAATQKTVKAIGQISGDLFHPQPIGFRNDTGNMHLPRGQSNHEENVVTDQTQNGPHFHAEEIGGSQHVPVGAQKLLPSRPFLTIRIRVHARLLQDLGNRPTSDLVAQILQRPLDASVAPAAVFRCHVQDQSA